MKLAIEDYVARISSATALQLVIITYELTIDHIENAIECVSLETKQFTDSITKARELFATLIDSLDLSYDIGRQLMLVYIRINKLIIDAGIRRDTEPLQMARQMLSELLKGWREIEKNDMSKPVMQGAQQVFAGLTYNKSGLSEYVPEDTGRGYKV